METMLQTHIKKTCEKHEAMNTLRRLKQKLLIIEHKMLNEEQDEGVTSLAHIAKKNEVGEEESKNCRVSFIYTLTDKISAEKKISGQKIFVKSLDILHTFSEYFPIHPGEVNE